jgi:precorrin-6Y C5,15-methyltransferase (decarboxylating)
MTWLRVIGLTEHGLDHFPPSHLDQLRSAELVIAPERALPSVKALPEFSGKAMTWPQPFLDIIPLLEDYRGKNVVVLATGDPLWFGAASTLVRYFAPDEMEITPSASGFQWAAARMGWPMHLTRCLTVHGRPHETVLKYLGPKARLLVLAHDRHSPDTIAALLIAAGYEEARLTVLGHIGGDAETRHHAKAKDWGDAGHDVPDFHVLAIECPEAVDGFLPLIPGLPDTAFDSDGKLTKSEVRGLARWESNGCVPPPLRGRSGLITAKTASKSPRAMPQISACRNGKGFARTCLKAWPISMIQTRFLLAAG